MKNVYAFLKPLGGSIKIQLPKRGGQRAVKVIQLPMANNFTGIKQQLGYNNWRPVG
ncbi:hypothetical protein [Bacillus sp. 1P06AnD]|uniref:hypothetical protein n=1 Tax=Bacillus sp. 1P06AnD TaxID=3132208 RepID=UPI0039A23E9A